jgi:predicted  nucleic acid-binding Zn-ribbon protein
MRETKELLLKLQKLDDEIDALIADEESVPLKKRDLEERLEALKAEVRQAKDESIELAKRRKDREVELDSMGEKKDRFKNQIFQVKSNREYEALQHEIAALDERGSQLEDEILDILEKSEQASKTITKEEQRLKEESRSAEEEQTRLDRTLDELREAIAIKKDERKRLVMDLDKALIKRYERIRESKGGLAVTSVENGACGGCFRRIPPHEMQNLKKDDRIITCEGCGRIIIWRWE